MKQFHIHGHGLPAISNTAVPLTSLVITIMPSKLVPPPLGKLRASVILEELVQSDRGETNR
jgi:hypothetical protein